jgi:hypothetical protein
MEFVPKSICSIQLDLIKENSGVDKVSGNVTSNGANALARIVPGCYSHDAWQKWYNQYNMIASIPYDEVNNMRQQAFEKMLETMSEREQQDAKEKYNYHWDQRYGKHATRSKEYSNISLNLALQKREEERKEANKKYEEECKVKKMEEERQKMLYDLLTTVPSLKDEIAKLKAELHDLKEQKKSGNFVQKLRTLF